MYNGNVRADYSLATLYYFINKTAYSGTIRYNSKGEYNVPYGKYRNFNASLLTEQHHDLLTRARIFNVDYREIFNLTHIDDFIFLDPPYDCAFSDYGNNEHQDDFNEESHRQLAQDFDNFGCMAMLVIGSTPLTKELYSNHVVAEYVLRFREFDIKYNSAKVIY